MVETELAWDLAEAAKGCLDRDQRNQVYIAIGVGDVFSAAKFLLRRIVRSQVSIPIETVLKLNSWVASYRDHPDEARLRDLIGQVTIDDSVELPRLPAPTRDLSTVVSYRQPNRRTPSPRKASGALLPDSSGVRGGLLAVKRSKDAARRASFLQRIRSSGPE
jgi:hypothetical protein